MGQVSKYLGPDWAQNQLNPYEAWLAENDAEIMACQVEKTKVAKTFRKSSAIKGYCDLLLANGASGEKVADVCRDYVDEMIPYVGNLSFNEKIVYEEDGLRPSDAKELAETHGGRWWKASGQYAGVEYRTIDQPFFKNAFEIWLLAAVSGDRERAKKVSEPYGVPNAPQLDAQYEIRETILRHALADDGAGECDLAEKLTPGYPSGMAPNLNEFPLGVIRRDSKMVISAVKKTTTRYKGTWDLNALRKAYEKKYGPEDGHYPPAMSWDEWHESGKSNLISYSWIISWWALAWLNIARWRGMDAVFENEKIFSEWVPLSLCQPG